MIRRLLTYTFLAISFCTQAQDLEQGQYEPDYDTNYIQDFRHRLNIAMLIGAKEHTLNATAPNEKTLLYRTNLPFPQYGIMLSYHWVNLAFTFPVPGLSYTGNGDGETINWNLGLGFTGRHWYSRVFYEYFKGYYVANPEVITPPFDTILQLSVVEPSLQSTTVAPASASTRTVDRPIPSYLVSTNNSIAFSHLP